MDEFDWEQTGILLAFILFGFSAIFVLSEQADFVDRIVDKVDGWMSQPAKEKLYESTIVKEVCNNNQCGSTALSTAITSNGRDLCNPTSVGGSACFGLCGKYYCNHQEVNTKEEYLLLNCINEQGALSGKC